jgi:cysteinyl-tRNA synthetase
MGTLNKLVLSHSAVSIQHPASSIQYLYDNCYDAMNDDFNSPIVIANLFEGVRIINSVNDGKESLPMGDLLLLKELFDTFVLTILGLKEEDASDQHDLTNGLMQLILDLRQKARTGKDYETSDQIRDALQKLSISVKDTKEGASWSKE